MLYLLILIHIVVMYSLQITGQALLEPDRYGPEIRRLYAIGSAARERQISLFKVQALSRAVGHSCFDKKL